jgi:hypothetical protein
VPGPFIIGQLLFIISMGIYRYLEVQLSISKPDLVIVPVGMKGRVEVSPRHQVRVIYLGLQQLLIITSW